MFYTLDLTKELEIPPRFLGPKLKEEIFDRLRQEVEGFCDGKHGFILAVTSLYSIGQGLVREGAGSATFNVEYRCIAFMPHKGEVLDATVKSVNKMGFFAEAGPLQLFVSNHLIPDDFEFDTSHEPAYVTAEGEKIVPGCEVRVRVVGTRVDANEIFAVATMSDDYLGLMSVVT